MSQHEALKQLADFSWHASKFAIEVSRAAGQDRLSPELQAAATAFASAADDLCSAAQMQSAQARCRDFVAMTGT